MLSMVPTGNDGTTGVCWGKLKTNWNNVHHLYSTHESGTNVVMPEGSYQGSLMT